MFCAEVLNVAEELCFFGCVEFDYAGKRKAALMFPDAELNSEFHDSSVDRMKKPKHAKAKTPEFDICKGKVTKTPIQASPKRKDFAAPMSLKREDVAISAQGDFCSRTIVVSELEKE